MFASRLRRPFYALMVRHMLVQRGMINETIDTIIGYMDEFELVEISGTRRPRQISLPPANIASIPPANGSCPLLNMPGELLRAFFSACLPPRSQVIEPSCGARTEPFEASSNPNRVVDLMTLGKDLCRHITAIVYEERTFSIHVHQGQRNAGIEFLRVGRQPLQYQADTSDGRFPKFSPGELFGFSRLKKLEIVVFPSDGSSRHTAINTYYMHLALVNLLGREESKDNRITSLVIAFAADHDDSLHGRRAIIDVENPWWDADNAQPRETSFHCISDIELVMQPFALLWGVHNVDIQLPALVASHGPTIGFVCALKRCMQGMAQSATFENCNLKAQLEGMRSVHEDYMLKILYGTDSGGADSGGNYKLEDLSDDDDDGDDDSDGGGGGDDDHDGGNDDNDDEENDDDGDDGPDVGHNKHRLSPSSNNVGHGRKRMHLSSDTSSGGPSGTSEGSGMDLYPSGNTPDTDSQTDLIGQFVKVFETTEGEARHWLERSNWDCEVALNAFVSSLELRTQAAVSPEEEDEPNEDELMILYQMMYGDQDWSTCRGTDNGASPTRASRAGPSALNRGLDQLGSFNTAAGPSSPTRVRDQPTSPRRVDGLAARLRAQEQRSCQTHFPSEEVPQEPKYEGKGKAKAKETDVAENAEESATWNNPSRRDATIARLDNPSNFSHQQTDQGPSPSDSHDVEMIGHGRHGSCLPDRPAGNTTHGANGAVRDRLISSNDARSSAWNPVAAGWRSTMESPYDIPGNDAEVFNPYGSNAPFMLGCMDRSNSPNRPNTYQTMTGRAPATLSTARLRGIIPGRPRRTMPSYTITPSPAEQETSEALERREGLQQRLRRLDAYLDNDPDARYARTAMPDFSSSTTEASRRIANILNPYSIYTARSASGNQRQPPPPPSTIPANTADDYPQWAGTSYWSAAAMPSTTPAPVPEGPMWSSPTANSPLRFATITTISNQNQDTAPYTSSSRVPDNDFPVQDRAGIARSTNSAATTFDQQRQHRANQDYWYNFRPEFGDEVVYISSDEEEES